MQPQAVAARQQLLAVQPTWQCRRWKCGNGSPQSVSDGETQLVVSETGTEAANATALPGGSESFTFEPSTAITSSPTSRASRLHASAAIQRRNV